MRTRAGATMLVLVLLSACAAVPARAPGALGDATLAVRIDDHLSLGLRLDALDVALDGRPLSTGSVGTARSAPYELSPVAVEPGIHALRLTAKVSLACGLFGEPRTRVTVHASSTVRTEGAPARVTVDLFARAPTSKPEEIVGVDFHGDGADVGVRGAPVHARHAECAGLDPVAGATCDVEALVGEARAAKDVLALSCAGERLTQIHGLRSVLDDAEDVAADDHTTYDQAMHAQLRARFAESRIRDLANEARRCASEDLTSPRRVDYAVEDACPESSLATLDER